MYLRIINNVKDLCIAYRAALFYLIEYSSNNEYVLQINIAVITQIADYRFVFLYPADKNDR